MNRLARHKLLLVLVVDSINIVILAIFSTTNLGSVTDNLQATIVLQNAIIV